MKSVLGRDVWKFPLPEPTAVDDYRLIEMPKDAKVVFVGHQNHVPTIWAEVMTGAPKERRLFCVYGTGWSIEDTDVYVGSYTDGPYVWHIYEFDLMLRSAMKPSIEP